MTSVPEVFLAGSSRLAPMLGTDARSTAMGIAAGGGRARSAERIRIP
jgi:hypothetical protein